MSAIKGARWYKTDLHLHTPASSCFIDNKISAREWVDKCIEEKLDCVAVTDHNTGEYIDAIKEEADGTKLTVFPGVEVTCSESKVHILVLFDVDKDSRYVNSFLHKLGIKPNELGEQETFASMQVMDVIREAHAYEGIAIPAHIDQYNGLGTVSHGGRSEIFNSDIVYGAQVVHKSFYNDLDDVEARKEMEGLYASNISEDMLSNWRKALLQTREYPLSLLTFSDNPSEPKSSKHGLWGIGSRVTWLKMDEEVSLGSLRQALTSPTHRVSNDFESSVNPTNLPDVWINKMLIRDTVLNSQEEEELYFNPQMTTIIGGRGTGKSSILRFLRGVFKKNKELEEYKSLFQEQEEFYAEESSSRDGLRRGVLKEASKIEVSFFFHGKKYLLKAEDFKKKIQELSLYEWNLTNNRYKQLNDEEKEAVLQIFNFDIYSQKQIYEIAMRPNSLREIIDNSISEIEDYIHNLLKLKHQYLSQSSIIREIRGEIEYKTRLHAEIELLERRLQKFEESNYQSIVNQRQRFSTEKRLIDEFLRTIEESKEEIQQLKNSSELLSVNDNLLSGIYKEELEKIFSETSNKFNKVNDYIQLALEEVIEINQEVRSEIQRSTWQNDFKKNSSEYISVKEKLQEEGIDELQNLEDLNNEIEAKKEQLNNIERQEGKLEEALQFREDIYNEYLQRKSDITSLRREFLNGVIDDSNHIKIEVKPERDRNYFENEFRRIIQKEDTFIQDINTLMDFCFYGNTRQTIPNLIRKIETVRSGDSDEHINGKFAHVIRNLNDEQLDEIKLLKPEDEIAIKYKDNNGGFQSLSNASAGQKTSAILAFLLSYGTIPLVLDQPEDDLDNNLIYDLIVESLKNTKHKRQVIIVTHNANIPVNGDSEYVIALDSDSTNLSEKCSRSIEVAEVRDAICKIMEGGEEAFKLRALRYNL
ncbi:TrlF family AAA-like ATPase [Salinicoccus roseus]|uniref:Polymerase/histidinol phosphatase N-terminal domain-containing protein n=1 Tax=Salinicoccus roseus TaxID=45670 RepID=A0A265E5B8_9STAP|nr:PHP domain-containing protein [Salinicoccus roseus]OZT76710.1 hypothetical protein CFN03_09590 [Salinicoccus roseus]